MLYDGVGVLLMSDRQAMNKSPQINIFANYTNGWKLKQQTNGDAITVYVQKPMLDNRFEKDRIT